MADKYVVTSDQLSHGARFCIQTVDGIVIARTPGNDAIDRVRADQIAKLLNDNASENRFTVWVMEESREGTTFVTSCDAKNIQEAAEIAIDECAASWETRASGLVVIGVAQGDVRLLEWNDNC